MYIIDTACLDECFLFHVITGRHDLLHKFIATQRFGATAMFLTSLKQVFRKKSAFYVYYLCNNIPMPLMLKIKNKPSTT